MKRNYNYIYTKLVENEYDIVGHIAYALYKADKIKFIESFKQEYQKEPEDNDLVPFNCTSCIDTALERYKITASIILQQFLDNTLDESTKSIEEKCIENHKQMILDAINPLTPPTLKKQYFHGVSQSVLGAFIFALLLAAVGFITLFKTNDINFSINPKTIPASSNITQNDSKN